MDMGQNLEPDQSTMYIGPSREVYFSGSRAMTQSQMISELETKQPLLTIIHHMDLPNIPIIYMNTN